MNNKIEKFLNHYNLTATDKVVAVGFSGGFDSLSLLHCLISLSKKYSFKIVAAHLNHNWRADESLKEEIFCREFCTENNIEFYTETLDKNEKHTETRARELRYDFFNRVINKYNADALLTAHTKSDTAETLIYRIIKGTGIKGLQGISPKLNKIYRPMLDISRKEVEEYCATNLLTPNNDSSNANNDYARNFIRNKILPLFNEINPLVENSLNNLSILAFEEEQIVQEYIDSLDIFEGEKIKTEIFKKLSKILQKRLIYEIFVKNDFEYTQEKIENTLNFVQENLDSKSGKKCSINTDNWLYVSEKYIQIIGQINKNTSTVKITKEGEYHFLNRKFKIEKCENSPKEFPKDSEFKAYIELNEPINFTLRTRQDGDIITPLGQKTSTKFKKYLINKNIPQHEKDSIILLCKEGEILWASGLGVNDKIKVVNKCTHVLTLKETE